MTPPTPPAGEPRPPLCQLCKGRGTTNRYGGEVELCDHCDGKGIVPARPTPIPVPCLSCGGRGSNEITMDMAIDAGDRSMAGEREGCSNCNGHGWILQEVEPHAAAAPVAPAPTPPITVSDVVHFVRHGDLLHQKGEACYECDSPVAAPPPSTAPPSSGRRESAESEQNKATRTACGITAPSLSNERPDSLPKLVPFADDELVVFAQNHGYSYISKWDLPCETDCCVCRLIETIYSLRAPSAAVPQSAPTAFDSLEAQIYFALNPTMRGIPEQCRANGFENENFDYETKIIRDLLAAALSRLQGELDAAQAKVESLTRELNHEAYVSDKRKAERDAAESSRAELLALINTPELVDFPKAVHIEAVHQIQRWGSEHDGGKEPEDWFWLVGYLAGKALSSWKFSLVCEERDPELAKQLREKTLHHIITTAAALNNWHAQILGQSNMRPGIDPARAEAALQSPKGTL
jgi:hypothetical protein